MSKFLDSIVNRLCTVLHGWTNADDEDLGDDIISIKRDIQQLGENARRMLEIGIVQDELVKLGFENFRPYISCFILPEIMVEFDINKVILVHQNIIFNYTSPTWQEDLINKVKEVKND